MASTRNHGRSTPRAGGGDRDIGSTAPQVPAEPVDFGKTAPGAERVKVDPDPAYGDHVMRGAVGFGTRHRPSSHRGPIPALARRRRGAAAGLAADLPCCRGADALEGPGMFALVR